MEYKNFNYRNLNRKDDIFTQLTTNLGNNFKN